MDWIEFKKVTGKIVEKNKIILLLLLCGLFFMILPKEPDSLASDMQTEESEHDLQQSLSQILSKIEGAGKVEVLLTHRRGEEVVYQMDMDASDNDRGRDHREEVVIIRDSAREEKGLIRQINPPQYQGAVVLSQGANDPTVKLSLVEAVVNATGLPSNRVTVLKMK